MKCWIIGILILLSVLKGISQEVKMYAYSRSDSLTLVWLPDGVDIWEEGIAQGFSLYRSIIMHEGLMLSQEDIQASRQLMGNYSCQAKDKWLEEIDTTDQWEVLAAGMVYGDFQYDWTQNRRKFNLSGDSETSNNNRYLFNLLGVSNSLTAMKRMGYKHEANGLKDNTVFLYELYLGESENKVGELIVQSGLHSKLRKLETIVAANEPQGVLLKWDIQSEYVNYSVYRSIDGQSWNIINDVPIMTVEEATQATYLDQGVMSDNLYQYCIRGRTIFGRWGPYSDVINIARKEVDEKGILRYTSFMEKEEGLLLGWKYEGSALLNSVKILYAEVYDGPYSEIGSSKSAEGNLEIKEKLRSGYILLEGVDEYGRSVNSVKRLYNPIDTKPPTISEGLVCEVDTAKSKILLKWNPVDEEDLMGYRIYFSNSESGNYLDIGRGVFDSCSWKLPLKENTNGDTMYFRIQAVDQRFNASDLSLSCMVQLPDRNPPAAPLIRKITEKNNFFFIEWATSPSWDVMEYVLEKREEEALEWGQLNLKDSDQDIRFYLDSLIVPGKTYAYRIGAIDGGRNITYSEVRYGKIDGYIYRPGVESFYAEVQDEQVVLSWQTVPLGALNRVVLYRAMNDGGFITYKTFGQAEMKKMVSYGDGKWKYEYKDKEIRPSQSYRYAIRLVWQDGNTSKKSEEVEIKW